MRDATGGHKLDQQCGGSKWDVSSRFDPETGTLQYGGNSVFGWDHDSETTTIGFDPLRVVESEHSQLNLHYYSDVTWNWDRFLGHWTVGVEYCEGKEPPGPVVDRDAPEVQVQAITIPSLALPQAFLDGGWRTVGLGPACEVGQAAYDAYLKAQLAEFNSCSANEDCLPSGAPDQPMNPCKQPCNLVLSNRAFNSQILSRLDTFGYELHLGQLRVCARPTP